MIASLAMYDPPPLHAANDRYWGLIRDGMRAAGLDAPDHLTRGPGAYWPAWQARDLVLGQTCGLPYRARLHGQVTLIGTPDYGLPDCAPGYYRSLFVARADDARGTLAGFSGRCLAYGDALSQSGWAAPQAHAAAAGLRWGALLHTGAHQASAWAVAQGRADLAAIDAVTWALLLRHEAWADRLVVVEATRPTPGLPYIAAQGADGEATFAVIAAAIDRLTPQDRDLLHLRGIVRVAAADYLAVPIPPEPQAVAPHRD